MHWLFLFGWNWSFLADSEWLFLPGANTSISCSTTKVISLAMLTKTFLNLYKILLDFTSFSPEENLVY